MKAFFLATAPDLDRYARIRTGRSDQTRQVARASDRDATVGEDDVPDFEPGLVRRATLLDAAHECTLGPLQSERAGDVAGHVGDRHADTPAHHASGRPQLLHHPHDLVDRNGERDAHETAGATVDLRIDPDHFPGQIDQRPAGIARIDGDVGLDERQIVSGIATLGRDDSGGDRVVESERRTDRQHPFTHTQAIRIADRHERQMIGLDLDQRHVGTAIGADQLAAQFALVGQRDVDFIGLVDDMMIGEDVAVGGNDETRTDAARHLLARFGTRRAWAGFVPGRTRRKEAPEEFVERIVFVESFRKRKRIIARWVVADALGRADVDHRRTDFLDQITEIGQDMAFLRVRRARSDVHARHHQCQHAGCKQSSHGSHTSKTGRSARWIDLFRPLSGPLTTIDGRSRPFARSCSLPGSRCFGSGIHC